MTSGQVSKSVSVWLMSGRTCRRVCDGGRCAPDGSVIVELLNAGAEPVRLNVTVGEHGFAPNLPARSLASVRLR